MERRLAVILAADVVNYSSQMEHDEAGTFERVTASRRDLFAPEIIGHAGRIFKTMGDGLLAEFSSAVQGVECAVAIQRGLDIRNAEVAEDQRIRVRIGINLGEVIVDGDDCYGEGVNIAARLEQIAEPGGILVSDKVAREVEQKLAFGFESLGEKRVKNLTEPIHVYRVNQDATKGHLQPRRARIGARRGKSATRIFVPIVMIVLSLATAYWALQVYGPARLSSAVLPFENTKNTPQKDLEVFENNNDYGLINVPFSGTIVDWKLFFRFTTECENDHYASLTSPEGTRLIVMDRGLNRCDGKRTEFSGQNANDLGLFLGSQAKGNWRFSMIDLDHNDYYGTLEEVEMNFTVKNAGNLEQYTVRSGGLPAIIPER